MMAARSGSGRWLTAASHALASPSAPTVSSAALAVFAVVQVLAHSRLGIAVAGQGTPAPFLLVLIALATTLPVGLLWSSPIAMAIVIGASCLLSVGVPGALTLAGVVAMLIAVYRLGRTGGQVVAAVIAAAFAVVAVIEAVELHPQRPVVLLAVAAPMAAWAGHARRARSEFAAREAQTEAIAGTLLEHTARGERARISRELHDVVAHHISMIAVQAETARLTTPGMPAEGAQRLVAIGDTARAALTEMRRLLGVLREDTRAEPSARQPQPGLKQLAELVDQARDAASSRARLIVSGRPAQLDPGVELIAYRIVQEALTNARRHAPGAAVDVELRYRPAELWLRIRDNGPGPRQGEEMAGGHGLLGMRERVGALGGTLHTGAAPGGGFLVEARLPAPAEQGAA
jgi:signal transduction histidine kinase